MKRLLLCSALCVVCGACNCGTSRFVPPPSRVVLSTVLYWGTITQLRSDATTLYFSDSNGIYSLSKDGGTPTVLFSITAADAGYSSVDGFNLWNGRVFACASRYSTGDLIEFPASGGAFAVLAALPPAPPNQGVGCSGVASNDASVYLDANGSVNMVSADGGALVALGSDGLGSSVVMSDPRQGYYVWFDRSFPSLGHFIQVEADGGTVNLTPTDGFNHSFAGPMAAAGGSVFAAINGNDQIWTYSKLGSPIARIQNQASAFSVATDGTAVYWSLAPMNGAGSIWQAQVDGGAIQRLTQSVTMPDLLQAGSPLYFVDVGDGGSSSNVIERLSF